MPNVEWLPAKEAPPSAFHPPTRRSGNRLLHAAHKNPKNITRYAVLGEIDGTPVEALPDTGASECFISASMVQKLGLSQAPGTEKTVTVANGTQTLSPGCVHVKWKFAKERKTHPVKCWILPGCAYDVILGSGFLKATQTLTKWVNRIKRTVVSLPRDTGSDVMLVSLKYARALGLSIDDSASHKLELELGDESTAYTCGLVHDVQWNVGDRATRCDFYVLEDLNVDVVLSSEYVFDLDIYSECSGYLFDVDAGQDLLELCHIRLISRYGGRLNKLEEQFFEDLEEEGPGIHSLDLIAGER
ncbi:hypothetical protein QBC33DRAFT_605037 [Phialemonium atrogriseum]|uniref:Uncharacterized protein n=1 Tax=Phialemonium atrogriseum TaxID=1093897 RepID=A0AAJ0BPE3_9PEZI|nr:uncharacterized protein QBC33DRAFT_605037 [Phialemonium atrogriseum]KAK1761642.1 hypothetical protein QBC33DRAFT_605037 [Phialemonium atrogriseum]